MRILYHAINGSGLGHLMRLSAIAMAVREHAPDVHQFVATSANYPFHLKRLRMPSLVLPNDDGGPLLDVDRRMRSISANLASRIVADVIYEYDPTVVVFDTHAHRGLVNEVTRDGRRAVMVFRHCRDSVVAGYLREGRLAAFDMILVPHSRPEMHSLLSRQTLKRLEALPNLRYVGGIAYPVDLDPQAIEATAAKHGISSDDTLVVVSSGSGGYGSLTRHFVMTACSAAAALGDHVRVINVGGPNDSAGSLPAGCTFVDSEPNMQLLMARADLVVSHGGYNTVHEILQTGARAAVAPIYRKSEDQGALLDTLVERGRVRRLDPAGSLESYAEAFAELLAQPRPKPEPIEGAARAAKEILSICDVPHVYVSGSLSAQGRPAERVAEPEQIARAMSRKRGSAVLRLDWDRVEDLLERLGKAARASIVGLEVHLGDGDVDTWHARLRRALAAIEAAGVDPQLVTVCLLDTSGAVELAELVGRVSAVPLRAMVAQVPEHVLRASPMTVFEGAERCRDLDTQFCIDITAAESPSLSIDQP